MSDTNSGVFVVRLKTDSKGEDDSHYHAKTVLSEEGDFDVVILDDDEAYSLELKAAELEEVGKRLRIDGVSGWAREAFCSSSQDHAFSLSVQAKKKGTAEAAEAELTWKRVGGGGGEKEKGSDGEKGARKMKVRVGVFKMTRVDDFSSALRSVLDASVSGSESRDASNRDLREGLSAALSDLSEAKKALSALTAQKAEAERELYERFLPILQSKQDKIAELMGIGGGGGASAAGNEDADDYGSDTDVDEEKGTPPRRKVPKLDDTAASQKSADDSQNFLKL